VRLATAPDPRLRCEALRHLARDPATRRGPWSRPCPRSTPSSGAWPSSRRCGPEGSALPRPDDRRTAAAQRPRGAAKVPATSLTM